jgi:hypothetical protein
MFNSGDLVSYLGCDPDQINWGSNDDPTNVLIQGDVYYVEHVEVHSWHTKLKLRNVKGKFNSVCFERYPV